jgi:endonuclease/exonuclease/phosphatase family metal-dependent hydrolase
MSAHQTIGHHQEFSSQQATHSPLPVLRLLALFAALWLPTTSAVAGTSVAINAANYVVKSAEKSAAITAATTQAPASLRLVSYNIRCGYCEPLGSPNHWDTRKFLLAHQLKLLQPDLIALQEAEHFQITELTQLMPEYRWYGLGRDDGKQQGEATAVLYRHQKLALREAKTLWLSPTPQQVSKGWGANLNRTLTLTRFSMLPPSDQSSAAATPQFYLLNTHFDHESDEARRQSAALILQQAASLPANLPLLLTGDLNLTAAHPAYQLLSSKLQDAALLPTAGDSARIATFNGFGQDYAKGVGKIDFIFVRGPLQVQKHWIEQRRDQGLYPSDHDPVIVDLTLSPVEPAI